MQTFFINTKMFVVGLCVLMFMTACAEWNSTPVVVEQNFGSAVRNMVKNQTLYPEHGQNDRPILTLDGQKAQGVVKDYRESSSDKLEKAKKASFISISPGG